MRQKIKIIRSRFQPFTRFHKEIIEECIKKQQQVALCIVRDYDTMSLWHRIVPNEVNPLELRHLPIFNPFSSWEIYLHIQSSLQDLSNRNNIPIIISPLKFHELIQVLSDRDSVDVPLDMKQSLKKTKQCDDGLFSDCRIHGLGKIISCISIDSMPQNFDFTWLIGMFDVEDKADFNEANKCCSSEQYNFPDSLPVNNVLPSELSPVLGIYGQFMQWIYLDFVRRYCLKTGKDIAGMPSEFSISDQSFLSNAIDSLAKKLKSYMVNEEEWNKYNDKIINRSEELVNKFENTPPAEKNVLLNYAKFKKLAETSIKVIA